jgi:hypothetical protein
VFGLAVHDCFVIAGSASYRLNAEWQVRIFKLLPDYALLVTDVGRVDGEFDDLLAVGEVADAEGGAKHLSGVESAVIQNLRVHEDHLSDVDEPVLLSSPVPKVSVRGGTHKWRVALAESLMALHLLSSLGERRSLRLELSFFSSESFNSFLLQFQISFFICTSRSLLFLGTVQVRGRCFRDFYLVLKSPVLGILYLREVLDTTIRQKGQTGW